MCVTFSGWVNEQCDIYRSDYTDSHNDLADLYGIKDIRNGKIFPFEFFPSDEKSYDDLSKYILRCDCDEPEWWDGVKPKLIEKMKIIIEPKIIRDHREILVGGQWILADGATVDRIVNAHIVIMLGSSSVGTMRESSWVGAMRESSRVGMMRESSVVNAMWESSRVGTMRESSVVNVMWELSVVNVMWDSSSVGTMRDSSSVGTMKNSSSVGEMRDSSQVDTMQYSSSVGVMRDSSRIVNDRRPK